MYLIGLDLGQAADYTAISVTRQLRKPEFVREDVVPGTAAYDLAPEVVRTMYHTQYLQRARRMSYVNVVERMVRIVQNPILVEEGYMVLLDQGGPGAAVGDMLVSRGMSRISRMLLTSGSEAHLTGGVYKIPKEVLVASLINVLQTGRWKIAQELELAEQLKTELLNFKMKITKSGNTAYEAALESIHDDLVMSCGMAIHYGEMNYHEEKVYKDRHKYDLNNQHGPSRGHDWDILNYGLKETTQGWF
jgi:hypothetical protein